MKKLLRCLLCILVVASFFMTPINISYGSNGIRVLLEGKELSFDVPPQIIEGRTMLPLRSIFEALGLEVGWDITTRIITGTGKGKEIILKLDSKEAKVNGINRTLDVPAKSIDGRTLVPVRFIAESLDMNVNWNQENRTVEIDKKDNIVTFKDPNFERAVRLNINKTFGSILKTDVEHIKDLSILGYMIDNLNSMEGIQHFTSLEKLTIVKNSDISDLTPLKNLNNLKTIEIMMGSKISNLEPIRNLIKLDRLVIKYPSNTAHL